MNSSISDLTPVNLPQAFNTVQESEGVKGCLYDLFIATNESKQIKTLDKLKKLPIVGNTMMATSGFFCLNAFIARGAELDLASPALKYLVVTDYSLTMETFWKRVEHIVIHTQDVFKAIEQIRQEVLDNANFYCPNSESSYVNRKLYLFKQEIEANISWASTQKNYEVIRSLFQKGHFVFKCGNLFDFNFTRQLAAVMSAQSMRIDTLYCSNISEYAELLDARTELYNSIKELKSVVGNHFLAIMTKSRSGGIFNTDPLAMHIKRDIQNLSLEQMFPASSNFSNKMEKFKQDLLEKRFGEDEAILFLNKKYNK